MDNIKNKVTKYYDEKVTKHGNSHWGVDWNSVESQELRFKQLLQVTSNDSEYSLLDYGCGFGSLYDYLSKEDYNFNEYIGYDISTKMIELAEEKNLKQKNCKWLIKLPNDINVDYTIASGIFNVKQETSKIEWDKYIIYTLNQINSASSKGFSFNILSSYSDKEYKKDYLYYANPLVIFDYCKRHFSKEVCLLHDYGLYEFTIIVRK